jgi:hypothetical protein
MLSGFERKVNLAHEFMRKADLKLLGRHLEQWSEVHIAGSANHGIHVADLVQQRSDARQIPDINPVVAMRPARAENFVAAFEFFDDGFADGAAGADH